MYYNIFYNYKSKLEQLHFSIDDELQLILYSNGNHSSMSLALGSVLE